MMRRTEWICDPSVAAMFVTHMGWRIIDIAPNPITPRGWGRFFCWWATMPPLVGPNECRRIGDRQLYMGTAFRRAVDFYVNSFRLEAAERLAEARQGFPSSA